MISLVLAIIAGALALLAAVGFAMFVGRKPAGNERVQEIGTLIQEGAIAFLRREYLYLAAFVIVVFVVIAVFIDFNVLDNERIESLQSLRGEGGITGDGPWTAISYLLGAIGSGIAGWVGMSIAVRANMRTATAAEDGLNPALRVAFSSGTVMGMTVVGLGLIGVSLLWWVFRDPNIIAGFGFGASSIALFARVGGGIYTKAADVGADLVGKVEAGLPEDDPRNPAVIADNVGDNVGDVAGMGADLFESYVGSIIAAIALGFTSVAIGYDADLVVLPMLVAGIGIISALVGAFLVRTPPQATMGRLLWSLRIGIFGAGALTLIGTGIAVSMMDFTDDLPGLDSDFNLFWVILIGLAVGQVIGTATEWFTSYEGFKLGGFEINPVSWIAKQSETGHPSTIIAGIAVGFYSALIPTLAVVIGLWAANELAGLYGVGLAAVGMLATLGVTLATDAYGPVADNAGGIAEQAHLDPHVRERTDALDALGNTTAATGKGFAIGSAVLTSLALMVAYGQMAGITTLNLLTAEVLIGSLIGALLPFLFSGLTMQAVGTAAGFMIEEVRRQFREIPGLREGAEGVKPDAARAVAISTTGALRAMILPGLVAIIAPIFVGAVLGPEALGGLLAGSIITGFLLAIFMANAGGAWDNAKKYIELGNHGGKGSDAHAAAVTGDTVGDPFKDTSGPSINILLKLMAIVSLIFGPLFV